MFRTAGRRMILFHSLTMAHRLQSSGAPFLRFWIGRRLLLSADKLNGNTQSDWKGIGPLIQIGHDLEYVPISLLSRVAGKHGLASHKVSQSGNDTRESPLGICVRGDQDLLPQM